MTIKQLSVLKGILPVALIIISCLPELYALDGEVSRNERESQKLVIRFDSDHPITERFITRYYNRGQKAGLSYLRRKTKNRALKQATIRPLVAALKRDSIRREVKRGASPAEILAARSAAKRPRAGTLSPRLVELTNRLANTYVVDLPERPRNARLLARRLKRQPGIAEARPELLLKITDLPSDTYVDPDGDGTWSSGAFGQSYPDLWGMKQVQAEKPWEYGVHGQDVVVAVIDTGVDRAHPDIQEVIWSNPGEIPGNGVDDDGNGYVDDTWGYDFISNDNQPTDGHGHGTHCAGTVASPINTVGVVGLAPQAKIMAVKGLSDQGSGSDFGLAQAVMYAADNGAHILSNSWGGFGNSPTLKDAFEYAHLMGATSIAAAGNDNVDLVNFIPANYPTVIAVAASDPNDNKASFSNFGDLIDVAAPGVAILSLRATGTDMYGDGSHTVDNFYLWANGTSMACPHVAGMAAMMISDDPTSFSPQTVRELVRASTDDLGEPGFDPYFGYGRINAAKAALLIVAGGAGFKEQVYAATATAAEVIVRDRDLNTDPNTIETVTVEVYSDSAPGNVMAVSLHEISPDSIRFSASVPMSPTGAYVPGTLPIADGDFIHVRYLDQSNFLGEQEEIIASSYIDGQPPVISEVGIGTWLSGAEVRFLTDETSRGRLLYGTDPSDLSEISPWSLLGTSHKLQINDLESNQTYYVMIIAEDEVGNVAIDDNQGQFYTFSTVIEVVWVDKDGNGDFTDLQVAIDTVEAWTEIRITQGFYPRPHTIDSPYVWQNKALRIIGGYSDVNGVYNPELYPTEIGSGDVGWQRRACVRVQSVPRGSLIAGIDFRRCSRGAGPLDWTGFAITDSDLVIRECRFEDTFINYYALRSMNSNLEIRRCVFKNNGVQYPDTGKGALTLMGSGKVVITDSLFENNSSGYHGGAILIEGMTDMLVSNSVFIDNRSAGRSGGALAMISSGSGDLLVRNSLFYGNSAKDGVGDAIYLNVPSGRVAELRNITAVDNGSSDGKSIILRANHYMSGPATAIVTNSIVRNPGEEIVDWSDGYGGNIQVSYSNVEGGYLGTGNIDTDPQFVSSSGDYRLMASSPCRNGGNPNFEPQGDELDLEGDPRKLEGRVDIGCDEFTPYSLGDMDCDGDIDFDDITPFTIALGNQPNYEQTFPGCNYLNGDFDGDGAVTFTDINPFIQSIG